MVLSPAIDGFLSLAELRLNRARIEADHPVGQLQQLSVDLCC
jgi:hypothetical protein